MTTQYLIQSLGDCKGFTPQRVDDPTWIILNDGIGNLSEPFQFQDYGWLYVMSMTGMGWMPIREGRTVMLHMIYETALDRRGAA